MRKGRQTRDTILNSAVTLASRVGLEGLSIGALAGALKMSKSGLFAHFGSREELQLATLDAAQQRFRDRVFRPALACPRGLPRLRALFDGWLAWLHDSGYPGGCVMLSAVAEFDDRPGPIKDRLAADFRELRGALVKSIRLAINEGHLRPDTDPRQFAFELFGIVLAASHDWRLHADPRAQASARLAFAHLLQRHEAGASAMETGLRPLRPDDFGREKDFLEALSDRTLALRRLSAGSREIPDERIRRLTSPVPGREYAVAATVGIGATERFAGVARYALTTACEEAPEAEFAFVVADAWQGRGLGRRLLRHLMEHARAAGIARMRCDVLATNAGALSLLRGEGYTITPSPGVASLRVACVDLS